MGIEARVDVSAAAAADRRDNGSVLAEPSIQHRSQKEERGIHMQGGRRKSRFFLVGPRSVLTLALLQAQNVGNHSSVCLLCSVRSGTVIRVSSAYASLQDLAAEERI